METKACECEHAAHFHDEGRQLTPNGNPGHKYGVKYALSYIEPRKTVNGTFHVCRDCARDCLHPDNH